MTCLPTGQVRALVRFGLNSANARRLIEFYEKAFGAQVERRDRHTERDFSRWAQLQGGAEQTLLKLGNADLELLEFDYPGGSYPQDLCPYDTRFQHFGIVVADMQLAMERLNAIAGWTAISTDGPQTLPPSAGGVTAFKFRDPDGHPLELLQFPAGKSPRHWELAAREGIFSGIDHSALSIRNIDRSLDFYHSLGLQISARTLNQGLEQQRLDGVRSPQVDVIALAPPMPTPHVELLHYRTSRRPPAENLAINDTAAARLILSSSESEAPYVRGELTRDPDGHFLEVLE